MVAWLTASAAPCVPSPPPPALPHSPTRTHAPRPRPLSLPPSNTHTRTHSYTSRKLQAVVRGMDEAVAAKEEALAAILTVG